MHFVSSLATPAVWAQWTWTFVLELCEHLHSSDFLHRKKVRAMRIIGGSEWLSELCMFWVALDVPTL